MLSSARPSRCSTLRPSQNSASHTLAALSGGSTVANRHRYLGGAVQVNKVQGSRCWEGQLTERLTGEQHTNTETPDQAGSLTGL